MIKRLIICSTIIILTGCATNPLSNTESKDTKNYINDKFTKKEKDLVQLIIKRDSGIMGSACSYKVLIDNDYITNLNGGEKAIIYLKPGNYVMSSSANGLCAGGYAATDINLFPNKDKSYRISSGQDGTVQIQASPF